MNLRKSTKLFLTSAVLGAGAVVSATTKEKPNVLLINIDDLGWSDLGFMGSDYYQTPNIDKLASQGMVFTNAYAGAANCAPSRACLLTGQATSRHGVYTVMNSDRGKSSTRKLIPIKNTLHIKDSNRTLGNLMKSAGYRTATMGKWHVTENPLNNGFDINVAGTSAGGPYNGGYHSPFKYPDCEVKEKGTCLTDLLTTRAIEFMTERNDQPFFLYLPYFAVHTPIQGKKNKIEKYKKLPRGKGHNNPNYAAMIESVDENVGKLMAALDVAKVADKTVVIFTSDNGGVYHISKQWPLRSGKGAYYEGGIREPFVVRWPGKVEAGVKNETPISQLDIFPTLSAISGASKIKETLDGVNLLPMLKGERKLGKRALYWHFPIYLQGGSSESRDPLFRTRPGSAIRFGDWKLHQYFEDGDLELYNLKNDLGEKNDLSNSNPEKLKELLKKLDEWRKDVNAPIPTKLNPDFGKPDSNKVKKNKQ